MPIYVTVSIEVCAPSFCRESPRTPIGLVTVDLYIYFIKIRIVAGLADKPALNGVE